MGNCGRCEHWKSGKDANNRGATLPPEWGTCGRIEMHDEYSGPAPGVIACVEDASGYHAALLSRDSFGCVLFTPRWSAQLGETELVE